MGFLKFAAIKLISSLFGALLVMGAVLLFALLDKHAPWVNYSLIGILIAYVFVWCWYEDYKKKQRYKQNLKRK